MAIFRNAKNGNCAKTKMMPSIFKTWKTVAPEPEPILDIFGVEDDMQELVALPAGATGHMVQSRFDEEMIQAELEAAIAFEGITKLEKHRSSVTSFKLWSRHPTTAKRTAKLLDAAISGQRVKFFDDLLDLDTSKDLELIGAFRGSEIKPEAVGFVVNDKVDDNSDEGLEDNQVLPNPRTLNKTSRLRQAHQRLFPLVAKGFQAFKTAVSWFSARK